jgi:hypothetical protein
MGGSRGRGFTVAFTLSELDGPMHAMAWDLTTDQVTRLADYTLTGSIALAPPD